MHSPVFRISAIISVLSAFGCSSAPTDTDSHTGFNRFDETGINRLAIITVDKTHRLPQDAGVLTDVDDAFTQSLLGKDWELADRGNIATAIKEIGIQQSGITDADGAQLGHILNVPAVLIVTVTELSASQQNVPFWQDWFNKTNVPTKKWVASASMSARLLKVQTSEILSVGRMADTADIAQPQDAGNVLPELATKLAQEFPDHKPSGS